MAYFYNVRLIEEGAPGVSGEEGDPIKGFSDDEGRSVAGDGEGEKWEGSVMEVKADKIS